jgi:N-acetylneuraminic acid mutarotase
MKRAIVFLAALAAVALGLLSANSDPGSIQASTTWNIGDVFAGVNNGSYNVYDESGVFKETISDGLGSTTTGCAFNPPLDRLYTTNFGLTKVVAHDDASPHAVVQVIDTNATSPGGHSESIVFAANGHFFVGHPDGNDLIHEYDAAGNLVDTDAVAVDNRGTDWIDLAADQKTMFYTSEGRAVQRFDVVNDVQLTNFAVIPGPGNAVALRLLPPGDGTGGLLVADISNIKRLDGAGNVVQTYDIAGEDAWFALNIDPTGTSFWSGAVFGAPNFYKFNISTGAVEVGPINTGAGNNTLNGLCVKGEITGAQQIQLTPATATNFTGSSHTVTATVSQGSSPVVGTLVTFSVTAGPNVGQVSDPNAGECNPNNCTTDANGQVSWTYTSNQIGTDTIQACFDDQGTQKCRSAQKTWVIPPFPLPTDVTCETLNPIGGTPGWTSLTPPPVGREGGTGVIVGDRIYVTHGNGPPSGDDSTVFIYDRPGDVWYQGANGEIPRAELAGVCANGADGFGNVYAIGGRPGLTANERYDPPTNTWATVASMPTGRGGLCATWVPTQNKVYAIGGRGADGPTPHTGTPLAVNEQYDPVLDSWATVAPMPIPMSDVYSCAFHPGTGRIYVVGGWDGAAVSNAVQIYDPVADVWAAPGAPMPTARSNGIAGICGNSLFVIGGYDGVSNLTTNERYSPTSNTWTPDLPKITPASEMAVTMISTGAEIYGINSGIFGPATALNERFICAPECPPDDDDDFDDDGQDNEVDDDDDDDGESDESDDDDDDDGLTDRNDLDDDNDGEGDDRDDLDGDGFAAWWDDDDDNDGDGDESDDDDDNDGESDDDDDDDDNDGESDDDDDGDGDDDDDPVDNCESDDDGDGVGDFGDNCQTEPNTGQEDQDDDGHGDDCDDSDGDGFVDSAELHVGTLPAERCGAAGWPANTFDQAASANKLDIQDVLSFVSPVRRLSTSPGNADFDPRWDLVEGQMLGAGYHINLHDITALLGGSTGNPPMFGGARAFGRLCSAAAP